MSQLCPFDSVESRRRGQLHELGMWLHEGDPSMTVESLSVAEIAGRLNYSIGTVYDWIGRGRHFPPFPTSCSSRKNERGNLIALYDLNLVEAWYERTHIYQREVA